MNPGIMALALAPLSWASEPGRPNVILVDICSARADHFGTYGYARDTTPAIDGLAKRGAVFENALAQSSWCLPNYATLFTGHRPEVHGLYTNDGQGLPGFEVTLAEKLREGGYATAAFSGGVYMIPEWGLSRGFDTYVNLFSTSAPNRVPAPLEDNLEGVSDWLKARSSERSPFFLYVAVDDLHTPYHSDDPERYDPGYEGVAHDTRTLSVPFARAYSGEASGYPPELKALASEFKSDPRHLEHWTAHYDAALRHVDGKVGALTRRLKELGLDKDTVLIVTADHGEMLGEKGLLGHTQGLYEPVLRVPLIVRHPGLAGLRGRRLAQQIQRVDLMPTILDMAGVSYDKLSLQGSSFLPLLRDPKAPWSEYAYASSRRNLAEPLGPELDERVIRTQRWKLHHYLYRDAFELYDLKADPLESRDLASSQSQVVSRLAFQLLRLAEQARPHQPGPPSRRSSPWVLEPGRAKD